MKTFLLTVLYFRPFFSLIPDVFELEISIAQEEADGLSETLNVEIEKFVSHREIYRRTDEAQKVN